MQRIQHYDIQLHFVRAGPTRHDHEAPEGAPFILIGRVRQRLEKSSRKGGQTVARDTERVTVLYSLRSGLDGRGFPVFVGRVMGNLERRDGG